MKLWLTFSVFFCFVFFPIQVVNAQTQEQLNIYMLEAADKGQADSVKYWINRGADVNYEDDNGFTALTCVISNGKNQLLNDLVFRCR